MWRLKSTREFDVLIAIHEVSGCFVKLNYGLILPDKVRIGEDGNPGTKQPVELKKSQSQVFVLNPGCTLMKTTLITGAFFAPN